MQLFSLLFGSPTEKQTIIIKEKVRDFIGILGQGHTFYGTFKLTISKKTENDPYTKNENIGR